MARKIPGFASPNRLAGRISPFFILWGGVLPGSAAYNLTSLKEQVSENFYGNAMVKWMFAAISEILKKQRSLTLIEIVTAVAILGVMAAVAAPMFNN